MRPRARRGGTKASDPPLKSIQKFLFAAKTHLKIMYLTAKSNSLFESALHKRESWVRLINLATDYWATIHRPSWSLIQRDPTVQLVGVMDPTGYTSQPSKNGHQKYQGAYPQTPNHKWELGQVVELSVSRNTDAHVIAWVSTSTDRTIQRSYYSSLFLISFLLPTEIFITVYIYRKFRSRKGKKRQTQRKDFSLFEENSLLSGRWQ